MCSGGHVALREPLALQPAATFYCAFLILLECEQTLADTVPKKKREKKVDVLTCLRGGLGLTFNPHVWDHETAECTAEQRPKRGKSKLHGHLAC